MKRSDILFSIWRFVLFFLSVSFTITCCFLLFLRGLEFPLAFLKERAAMTFFNIIPISLIFTGADLCWRVYFVRRPIKNILAGTRDLRRGNFEIKIPHQGVADFDIIIDDINTLAEELSGIETLRTDFISNVSHELKTPLAVIQNYSSMLQSPDLSAEERGEYIKTIIETSKKLSGLTDNILKLNKLENQQIFPHNERYDLSEQICECLFAFENAFSKKHLNIKTDIADNVYIHSDSELLSLVWNNLLSNAVKFTDDGGTIAVSLKSEKGAAVVSVEDTGCGIDVETGRHIFEKFYQGDRSHAVSGNGLGLALVKRVTDIVGGNIELKSKTDEGSRFTIAVPLGTDK